MEKTSVIRPDLTSPGAYLISSLCTMSWSSVTSGKWPSWSVSKCSRSWRHRSQKPRVRPREPLCELLLGGAASLPWRGIQSLFRADFCGLPRLCGGRRKRQEKGIGAFRANAYSQQPAVRAAARICGFWKLALFSRFPERFDAKFEKSRRKAPCHNGLRRRFDRKSVRFIPL